MNEAQTKHDLIEPALREAGWGVVEGSRLWLEFPITQGRLIGHGQRAKPLSADYVLEYKNRRIGVVEAKKRDVYYTDGVGQAKDYAQRLNIRYTFATNGLQIYSIDMDEGMEGDVIKFPTPDELWEITFPSPLENYKKEIALWRERLFAVPFEDRGGTWQPRYYQNNAIVKVLESIAAKQNRILITLATGTGKTAIAFQIAWKLFHAKWNLKRDGLRSPRILFLADRNILADQAFNSFNAFDVIDENIKVRIRPAEIKKKGKVPTNGNVFFTIFQTFMTEVQQGHVTAEADVDYLMAAEDRTEYNKPIFNFGQYEPDFFDLIIIDECHRGGANDESSWRAIMEHFSPAVQLGLTATPKRDINGDTYEYFGEPVYTYALKDGINDGFLSPFRVKEIQTNYDEYTITSDDEVIHGEAEVGDTFTYNDYGRKIIIEQVERYRVQRFMAMINQKHKTLVFCSTQVHAAYIRDLINQTASSKNSNYCHRVTADDGGMGEAHLRDFQDNEKNIPTILTTSQKLSTGVDAPEIRNIVLLRPVESMVEFKQIVGRGTRLFLPDKNYFTVYDFTRAHKHFQDPAWDGPPEAPEPSGESEPRPPCEVCGLKPCACDKPESVACAECDNDPCVCDTPPKQLVRVKLSNGKALEIDGTVKTMFWDPDGKPISGAEFIQKLFGDIPSLFKSEEQLRKLWSSPGTRHQLLVELEEKGYTKSQLEELRQLVHGKNSDLYDVLNHVAYQKGMVPRAERALVAQSKLVDYTDSQQEFLNFVLSQYVNKGVYELDDDKLPKLLELKYKAIQDAKAQLGDLKSIRAAFIGFQSYLYDSNELNVN